MVIESFLFTFAGGGALGFAAGFSIKRIIKIALVILGAFVLAMTYISYKGLIRVDWDRAQHLTTSAAYNASEQVMKAQRYNYLHIRQYGNNRDSLSLLVLAL
jgi:uncharacterized membrane protein (Fun14 family)